ncbi:GtrA family protein [Dokdonella immobilis]|uniref:Putative flippase GtrA (Transmembrane translocase of bactoprenol-linked glucose) n=1 Tax=Dokdonella immobilis TaxID=578942 RepID=A0A1I4W5Q5_9GAMM|nr:GtrA family protein [Dokdonella immobilis]SFN08901.1 Putative flippase GtrA (transmembrane translocase of bactoprenol-linked glucose) [Dokdonella immobilis]
MSGKRARDCAQDESPCAPLHRRLAGEFLRFLIVGGINTLVAYAIYLALLGLMRYEFAYAIGYAVGIVIAYLMSAAFVFRKPMRKRSAFRFPLIYAVQFLVSLAVLRLAVEIFHVPQWFAFGFAVCLTIPITFVLSRWVMHST